MKRKYKVWIAVAAVVIVVGGPLFGIFAPRLWAEPAGRTEQIVAVNRGNYRTTAYELFYDLDEQIEALDVKLQVYPAEPDDMNSRERTECRGLLLKRATLVADYNASARQELTVGQWRSEDLPHSLPQDNPREC
ncbi:hypothetical protein [Candidatus Poriferisodalis sp.]|uniref:hypothetical protein n=1 Tax=Candidatus Poriferisodalis sp. TaxID=3101277 RepID=UPI003D0FF5A4